MPVNHMQQNYNRITLLQFTLIILLISHVYSQHCWLSGKRWKSRYPYFRQQCRKLERGHSHLFWQLCCV